MSYSLTRFYILHLFENRPFQLASLFIAKLSIIVIFIMKICLCIKMRYKCDKIEQNLHDQLYIFRDQCPLSPLYWKEMSLVWEQCPLCPLYMGKLPRMDPTPRDRPILVKHPLYVNKQLSVGMQPLVQ
jgi:hypothetical protein